MSAHAFFSPSASARWMACPGSMTFPQNTEQGGSSTFADEGTAAHELGAWCLADPVRNAIDRLDDDIEVNGAKYHVDEDFVDAVQTYVDDVRRRTIGGHLLVEQKVSLEEWLGPEQFGTSDAIGVIPRLRLGIVEDLKFGRGERVYAYSPATPDSQFTITLPDGAVVEPNSQLMLYGLGSLEQIMLLCDEVTHVTLVISQPRLNHLHEITVTVGNLRAFGQSAKSAVAEANAAMIHAPNSPDHMFYLVPGDKQCRWCRAMPICKKLANKVAEDVRADFDTIAAVAPQAPLGAGELSRAMVAIPLISAWCNAVVAEVHTRVRAGEEIIGADGKPYKYVQGDAGKRQWVDEKEAEAALLGQLSEAKAYAPRKIITAPAAGKLLDKKKTKAIWDDVFVPLIKKAPGQPMLVMGSDSRPPYSPGATANEFDEISAEDAE